MSKLEQLAAKLSNGVEPPKEDTHASDMMSDPTLADIQAEIDRAKEKIKKKST
jgi:hypothetical protein